MQAWEEFLNQQETTIGTENTNRWLRSLKITHFDACNLYLEANDAFQIIWFQEHMLPKARILLVNNNNHPIKVHLSLSGSDASLKAHKKENKKRKNHSVNPSSSIINFCSDTLDPYATFEHFLPNESNHFPFKLLSELSHSQAPIPAIGTAVPLATFNPIYIYGGSGVGKTHLLMAAANYLSKTNLNVFFVRAETFTEHVVNAIRNGIMQDFRMAYRHVDVLIIDDVHIFARKSATQEEFFHTFNTLHTSGRQIILSANTSPQLLQEIEPRLVSRFEWGITLHLEKMSSPQLQEFIVNRCNFLNFGLKPEIIEFLVKTFAPNTKAIQKALDTLILRSHLDLSSSHKSDGITLEIAEHFLGQLVQEQEKIALNPNKIVGAVADFYGITSEDIFGKSQSQDCSIPRQMSMFLCRKELKMPFIKIGNVFSRDHSTVMSSVKLIEKRAETQDKEICSAISDILRRLEN